MDLPAGSGDSEREPYLRASFFPADRLAAERQDFLAGAGWAEGTRVVTHLDAQGRPEPEKSAFVLEVGSNVFRVSPGLRDLLDQAAAVGGVAFHASVHGGLRWQVFPDSADPLVKVTLQLSRPRPLEAAVVLDGPANRETLWHMAQGGLTLFSTPERLARAATFAETVQASLVLNAPPSAAVAFLCRSFGWPAGRPGSPPPPSPGPPTPPWGPRPPTPGSRGR